MAFVPTFDFCVEKNTTTDLYEIIVTDTTDVYDVADNPTGWQNAATLLRANVTAATLTILYTNSDGTETTTTVNVLSEIPDPVIGQMEFDPITFSGDGIYKITYTITTASTTYTACVQKVPYPNTSCCISNIVKDLSEDLTNKVLFDTINKVKAFEQGMINAIKTVDAESTITYLKLLESYCDYDSSSDCGCK